MAASKYAWGNGSARTSTRRGKTRSSHPIVAIRWRFSVGSTPRSTAQTVTPNSLARKIELTAWPEAARRLLHLCLAGQAASGPRERAQPLGIDRFTAVLAPTEGALIDSAQCVEHVTKMGLHVAPEECGKLLFEDLGGDIGVV